MAQVSEVEQHDRVEYVRALNLQMCRELGIPVSYFISREQSFRENGLSGLEIQQRLYEDLSNMLEELRFEVASLELEATNGN